LSKRFVINVVDVNMPRAGKRGSVDRFLQKYLDKEIVDQEAWMILELLRRKGGVLVYEDEDVDDSECYIVVISYLDRIYYIMVKTGGHSVGLLLSRYDEKIFNKMLSIYESCVSR